MGYIVAGLVLGGIYAIAAAGIVVTYASAGVLNFAFAAEAYFIARLYYYLHSVSGWGILPAAVVSLGIASPLIGLFLYAFLFRYLQFAATLIKVVATIGLSIAIPALAVLCFGNADIPAVPGLSPTPVPLFHVLGTVVSLNQVIVLICVVVVAILGGVIIRFTDAGLAVRSTVDSPALTALSGTSPKLVAAGVWASMTFLAGLAGVLVAPFVGLSSVENFTLLIASAFAAVVAAKLRFVGRAVLAGLALGVFQGILEVLIPFDSPWLSRAITALPFAVMAVAIFYFATRGQAHESGPTGGAIDRAIAFEGSVRGHAHRVRSEPLALKPRSDRRSGLLSLSFLRPRDRTALVGMLVIGLLPLAFSGIWVGAFGLGFAYAVVFLSFTLLTGEGGMISLCQVTFAAIGGIAAAQLATIHHWPVLAALVVGGLIAVPIGVAVGLMSMVLGDLYLAIVTLTFGLLMDNLVFSLNVFENGTAGVPLIRPTFLLGDRAFTYFVLAVFCVFAVLVANLRRSTTGLGVAAVRWSDPAARTMGLSVLQMKLLVTACATFVAGVGGGLLAVYDFDANPLAYSTLGGLVWLGVAVTVGIRSNVAAAVGGVSFAIIPLVFTRYLPLSLASVPTALFGIGAVLVTRNPDGTVAMHARQLEHLVGRFARKWSRSDPSGLDGEVLVGEGPPVSVSAVREPVEVES